MFLGMKNVEEEQERKLKYVPKSQTCKTGVYKTGVLL